MQVIIISYHKNKRLILTKNNPLLATPRYPRMLRKCRLAPRIVNIRSTKKTRYRREGISPLNNSSRKKEKEKEKKTEGFGSSLFRMKSIQESLRT